VEHKPSEQAWNALPVEHVEQVAANYAAQMVAGC
jgi:hypothetical protein